MCLFTVVLTLMCMVATISAQSTFHTDAFRNSFTVKVPGSQQTFTRFFGGQPETIQSAQQQLLTQPGQIHNQQQYQASPQLFGNAVYEQQLQNQQQTQPAPSQQMFVSANQQHYLAQRELIQLQQQQQQQAELQYQQHQQLQQQQLQQPDHQQQLHQQPITSQDLGAYFQQVQRAQQLQQSQQQYQPAKSIDYARQQQQQQPQRQQPQNQQQPQQLQDTTGSPSVTNHLLGVAYSPSNQVSQVKFSSSGLNYNF